MKTLPAFVAGALLLLATPASVSAADLSAGGALVARWVDSDAARASEWIRSLSHGPVRDKAVAEFGLGLFSQNRELALQWTQQISNETVRQEQTEELVSEWLLSDEEDARRWIEQSSLPGEMKVSLLAMDGPADGN
ncbi:MAG: hypothetical protein ACR2OZ_01640 [Verrucomicrobiales bacterium]